MIARIIRTILRYPVGSEVEIADEFMPEHRRVSGYCYGNEHFYVVFSDGSMIVMEQMDKLVTSVKIKRREKEKCRRVKR